MFIKGIGMQALKDEIRIHILTSAQLQFTKEGYLKTSMRKVADGAGVGLGNIYNYYKNKDELFRAVVRPVTNSFERMMQQHHGRDGRDVMEMTSENYFNEIVDEYVSLIKSNRRLMGVLLFKAQGSSLEHFKETFTDKSTALVKEWFVDMKVKHPQMNTAVSDFIIHLHTVWMFTLLEEAIMHKVSNKDMEQIVKEYIYFEIEGWKRTLKI